MPLPDGAGDPVLFGKLYDIAPDGTVTLKHKLVSAARISDFDEPVRIELPGVVQRFEAGHRLAVVLAASDAGYRGNVVPGDVTVTTTAAEPGVLELPVLSARSAAAPAAVVPPAAPQPAARPAAAARPASRSLAATGASTLLPLAGLGLLAAAFVARRRRGAAQ